MSTRIKDIFAKTKAEKRSALVTYTMASDPDLAASLEILNALPAAGADILELGMPFSDPMAEGPTIQRAAKRALEAGGSIAGCLEIVRGFRKQNMHTPLILMGYYNPVYFYGIERFVADCQSAGVDGFILVDLPMEEEAEFTAVAEPKGLALIRLCAPTTPQARAKKIYSKAQAGGFAYYVSVKGVTGTKSMDFKEVEKEIKALKEVCTLPVFAGFGIKTPDDVAKVAQFADGVVVGSAIVKIIEEQGRNAAQPVAEFVKKLASGLGRTEV